MANCTCKQDGVGKGYQIGVVDTFANYYMCHIESTILNAEPTYKHTTYCRYIDNIFVITDSIDWLLKLKITFKTSSVINFNHGIGTNNHLNFLDVHVDATQPNTQCLVYQKPTNSGIYLNYNSESPQRYNDAIINAIIHRTYKISSTWQLLNTHISHL